MGTKIDRVLLEGCMQMNKIAVVMYHYVRDFKSTQYPGIKGLDIRSFEEQIKYFSKNYSILSMENLICLLESQKELPSKAMLLTFDDGYSDHYQYVFPVLKKFGLSGAFYVPSKAVEKNEVLNVNKIHFLLATTKEELLVSRIFNYLDSCRSKYNLKSNEEYFELYKNNGYHLDTPNARFIKKMLQLGLPVDLRDKLTNILFSEYFPLSESELSKELYLSEAQIIEMHNSGMHIGSHAHSHMWLNTLSVPDQEYEISQSMEFLRKFGISQNLTICYPFGGANQDTLSIAKKLGFKLGFTTNSDVADFSRENLLGLSRIDTNEFPKAENATTGSDKWFSKL